MDTLDEAKRFEIEDLIPSRSTILSMNWMVKQVLCVVWDGAWRWDLYFRVPADVHSSRIAHIPIFNDLKPMDFFFLKKKAMFHTKRGFKFYTAEEFRIRFINSVWTGHIPQSIREELKIRGVTPP